MIEVPPQIEALLQAQTGLPHARHTVDPRTHALGVAQRVPERLIVVALCHDLGKVPELDIGEGRYRGHPERSAEIAAQLNLLTPDQLFLIENHHVIHDSINNIVRNNASPARLARRLQNHFTRAQLIDLFELTVADDWDVIDSDVEIQRVRDFYLHFTIS